MAQEFDDIQVSDKGMIKLIRNNGKDYVFPANRVIRVMRIEPPHDEELDLFTPIVKYLFSLFDVKVFEEEPIVFTIGIETSDDYLYINKPYSIELQRRINDACAYSTRRAIKKYGTFK